MPLPLRGGCVMFQVSRPSEILITAPSQAQLVRYLKDTEISSKPENELIRFWN